MDHLDAIVVIKNVVNPDFCKRIINITKNRAQINLNDSYEGGDLVFCDQNKNEIKRFNLGKGSIVFFPGNFMYPHAITPITKGTRYSIVAWLQ